MSRCGLPWPRLNATSDNHKSCRVTVNTTRDRVVQTVCVRNVGHELGVSSKAVVENAARYLAFKRGTRRSRLPRPGYSGSARRLTPKHLGE